MKLWERRRDCGKMKELWNRGLWERMGLWEHRGLWERLGIVGENGALWERMNCARE